MGVFHDINAEAHKRGLDFLVIGGIAVIFHGYSRDTADLDLLILKENRGPWLNLLTQLQYTIHKESENFVQLSPPREGAWPVDLMLVKEGTFRVMLGAAIPVEMFGEKLLISTLDHLLALTLHALKHGHVERYLKDYLDVENLVKINQICSSNTARLNCMKKYPTPPEPNESKLNESAETERLEFPIAPDFISRPPRLDPQVMLRRVEENMPWRSTRPGEQERRLAMKVDVEFVL